MRITLLILFSSLFSSVFILSSCTKDSEEKKLENFRYCKDSLVSFSANVQPILSQDCASCHTGASAENGVELDSYIGVTTTVTPELLMDCMKHTNGAKPMPQGKPKLNDCKIATIQKWISEGMLNN